MPSKHSLSYYTNAADTQIDSRYVRLKKIMTENPLIPIGKHIKFYNLIFINRHHFHRCRTCHWRK